VVSPAMVLSGHANFKGIFGVRSVDLDGFFMDTRSSVVVAGFLRSGCVKPRPWWSLLLGAWPACRGGPTAMVGGTNVPPEVFKFSLKYVILQICPP
jgi:hypothetical protein